jgi:hypothetical protein
LPGCGGEVTPELNPKEWTAMGGNQAISVQVERSCAS